MKRQFKLISWLLLILFLASSCSGNSFAGEYRISPSLTAGESEWILASDGTARAINTNGTEFLFDWAIDNGILYLKNYDGKTISGNITIGKEYSTLELLINNKTYTVILEKIGDAPKSAYNKNPDVKKLIGCYGCKQFDSQFEYSFNNDGEFTYSSKYDKFKCPYTIADNYLTIHLSEGVFFNAFGTVGGPYANWPKTDKTIQFDITDEGLVIFSSSISVPDIFVSHVINKIERLADPNFDESNQKTANDFKVYWSPFGHTHHIYKDCEALNHAETLTEGTVEQAIAANRTRLCKFCADRFGINTVITD